MRKWFSLLLAVMLLLATMPVLHAEGQEIRIDQIYGGGGKEDTPIANSFLREIGYVIEWGQLHFGEIIRGRKINL